MKREHQYLKIAVLFIMILFLAGCEAPYTKRKDVTEVTPGQSIVFGKIEVEKDGKTQEWGMGLTGIKSCCLLILPPDTSKAITYNLDEDGVFFWSLEPGDYQIIGFRLQEGTASRLGRIGATFTVPENAGSVYIGDITIKMLHGRYATFIEDNSSQMQATFESQFPTLKEEVSVNLLQLPDRIGTYDTIMGQCNEHWVIECDDTFRGVTPLTPKVATNQFPKVDSLTPRFSWETSGNQDVTYDFILYEAATFDYVGTNDGIVQGRMVEYVEDIQEPEHRLDKPLNANSKYYWSVRMRDGDMVSAWSTYSHFGFYVFYMTSGYGQWFAFSTP